MSRYRNLTLAALTVPFAIAAAISGQILAALALLALAVNLTPILTE